MSATPACPKCESTKVQLIGSHKQYPAGANRRIDPPSSENFAYKCDCGYAFTDVVRLPVRKQSQAGEAFPSADRPD